VRRGEGETAMVPGSYRSRGWSGEQYAGGIGSGNYESEYAPDRRGCGSEQFQDRDERPYGYGRQLESHTGRGPRGYRRSDERILEDVCERLTKHRDVDASDIEVDVRNGVVTMTGTVEGRSQKFIAEQIAESVSGVTDIHNRIRVARHRVTG
jgi:hypothetical protein